MTSEKNGLTLETIRKLPKVELHCHLEGALHLPTLWAFSQKHDPGRYATFDQFKAAATVEKGTALGFKPFLAKFDALRFHYGTLDDLREIIHYSVQDLTDSDFIALREFRFSPVFFARRLLKGDAAQSAEISPALVEEVAEAVIIQVRDTVNALTGRPVEFIATCARDFGYSANNLTLDLLHRPVGKLFKGLDLAGDESCDAADFIAPFREWRDAGKTITIHAGEDPNAGGPRNIIEALDVFGAHRIGHGVRAIEDSALVARLAREQIPLELCPTSNVQTGAVKNAASHPLKKLLDAGVCVTINTDDPTICGTTMDDEYLFAAQLGLRTDDLKRCTLNALNASVFDEEDKRTMLRAIIEIY